MRPHRRRGDYVEVDAAVAAGTASPDWSDAVEAFLRDARSRKCSPATIGNYRTYLLGPRAQQMLRDHEIRTVADVTAAKFRDFQAELLEAGLSVGTAATFHRIVRNFLGFCRRERWGVGAETLEVAPPRQATVEPETFTSGEEQRIIEAARTGRDRFLLEFMLRTGLRLSELASVTVDDIVTGTEGSYVRVRNGEGQQARIVPLDTGNHRFSDTLQHYVRNERPADAKDRHLFLTTRRDRVTGDFGPLEAQGIKMLLRRVGQTTGIRVYAYRFRHTFGVRALAAGVDSLVLQRALGHATPAMVNRYAHFQARDPLEAWRARSD
jgi:integrase/recombinase XerD